MKRKPKLAVWKFASCDGCQLSILDCEDQLLTLAEMVQIANFAEASSTILNGPYDLSLVEGSISTPDDRERILEVRRVSKQLIVIGACATAGGIQALRNFMNAKDVASQVYPNPEYIRFLSRSTPISDHVKVDYELRGCPINKLQLLEVISAFLQGRKPAIPRYAVCVECKELQRVCVTVAKGEWCLGPMTMAGCGAICPAYGRGCYGCFGVAEAANPQAFERLWSKEDATLKEVIQRYRVFNANSEAWKEESELHEPKK